MSPSNSLDINASKESNGEISPFSSIVIILSAVTLPTDEYETFGGFVFGSLGAIPDDGSQLELDACGLHIKVLEIKEHRMERAAVCLLAPAKEETEA